MVELSPLWLFPSLASEIRRCIFRGNWTIFFAESTRPQSPQPAAGPSLSMNIKSMYIVLSTSAPVFYCFNNTQGIGRDHFLTHLAVGLASLCKSPVLDRKKKKKKLRQWVQSYYETLTIIIFQGKNHTPLAVSALEARFTALLSFWLLKEVVAWLCVYSRLKLIVGRKRFKMAGKERSQLNSVLPLIWTLNLSGRVKLPRRQTDK